MRTERALSLAVLAVLLVPGAHAGGQPRTGIALRIEVPELAPGAPATVDVFVSLPNGPERPLALTPSAVGEALRVLRGRLLRADAQRTPSGELHFRVPVEPRSEGTAVLRFSLLTYACAVRCEAVRLSESRTVEVRAR